MSRAFLLSVFLLAISACATQRPPHRPEVAHVAAGSVHASSKSKAREVADLLAEFTPRIASTLPGCAQRSVDVRLVEALERKTWGGVTYTVHDRRWIELPESLEGNLLAATFVHELVHYFLGPEWSTLPGILEEGVCDNVAHRLVPAVATLERAEYAVMLSTVVDGDLKFDAHTIQGRGPAATFGQDMWTYTVRASIERAKLPSFEEALRLASRDLEPIRAQGVRGVLDALGYLVVARIGIDDLHRLCRRARELDMTLVPPAWLFAAAHLDPRDRGAWHAAISKQFGEAERIALLRHQGLTIREAR